jgi:hypothetical protein
MKQYLNEMLMVLLEAGFVKYIIEKERIKT